MTFLDRAMDVVAAVRLNGQLHEVCVSAVAHHDEVSCELFVSRDAFLRRTQTTGPAEYVFPQWLPAPGMVRCACPRDHASRMAGKEFAVWAQQVEERVQLEIRTLVALRREELWPGTGCDWVAAGDRFPAIANVRLVPC